MATPGLAAVLGPAGALISLACLGLLTGIWGLFTVTIGLAAITKRWVTAVQQANGLSSGAEEMMFSSVLLLGILFVYGVITLRRATSSAN